MERLFDIAEHQMAERPNGIMLAGKEQGKWVEYTCKEVVEQSIAFAEALLSLDISVEDLSAEKVEKIAIVSNNRPEWIMSDLAIQQSGAIIVPIYPTISPQEFAFILEQSKVHVLIVANQELYDRFQPAFKDLPQLKHILSFEEVTGATHWKSLEVKEEARGKRLALRDRIGAEDLATIIYTSGTTGKPKGVMLTHRNIVSNVLDCMPVFEFAREDGRTLSFLPLNHIFEKTVSYIYINAKMSIYYAESIDTIGKNLKEVKPIVFTAVPRLLEKVYEKIMATGRNLTGIKRVLFFWAVALGQKYDPQKKGSAWYRIQLKWANQLIFSKWREALGGETVAVVSGSAPLVDYLNRIFCAAQIPVMEGYGLTETSPVISVNRFKEQNRMIGTVGETISNVEVKIAEDGEILSRGPNNMLGYYLNPETTAEVIDADGWLHTGDIGEWVEGKYLKITDRKNDMFKTSGGKFVAPQAIENKFKESRYVSQIMVIGPNRKYVSAVIVPNFNNVRKYLQVNKVEVPADLEAIIQLPEVLKLFEGVLEKYNPNFGHVEQIKRFALLTEEWTIENGILTPKLSLRRKKVYEKYAATIEGIYAA